jgi:hypothetical protein
MISKRCGAGPSSEAGSDGDEAGQKESNRGQADSSAPNGAPGKITDDDLVLSGGHRHALGGVVAKKYYGRWIFIFFKSSICPRTCSVGFRR